MNSYQFDWGVIPHSLPLMVQGLVLTIEISVIVIVIATVLGFPLAVARMSRHEIIRWPAQAYIEVFRCTPLLVQLLWVFYALPALLGITIPAVPSVCIALTANMTAFMAEIYRAGMQSVPVEQIEAAEMLRLTRYHWPARPIGRLRCSRWSRSSTLSSPSPSPSSPMRSRPGSSGPASSVLRLRADGYASCSQARSRRSL